MAHHLSNCLLKEKGRDRRVLHELRMQPFVRLLRKILNDLC